MDKQRAKEIASSPIMANVKYKGQNIYIANINDSKDTAIIHPLENPRDRQEVPINSLNEIR